MLSIEIHHKKNYRDESYSNTLFIDVQTMSKTLLTLVLIISGILFTGSVLMMSAKGGLGMGIGGASGTGDYGSKKSIETKLKKTATISFVVFMAIVIFLPYAE